MTITSAEYGDHVKAIDKIIDTNVDQLKTNVSTQAKDIKNAVRQELMKLVGPAPVNTPPVQPPTTSPPAPVEQQPPTPDPVIDPPVIIPTSQGTRLFRFDFAGKALVDVLAPRKLVPYVGSNLDPSLLSIVTMQGRQVLHTRLPAGTNAMTDLQQALPSALRNYRYRMCVRFDTNFDTDGKMNSAAAMALKVLGPNHAGGFEGRATLDLTDRIQYQASNNAKYRGDIDVPEALRGVEFMAFMNSFDPNQGSQRYAVGSEFTDGLFRVYEIESHHLDDYTVQLDVYHYLESASDRGPRKLTVTTKAVGHVAPDTGGMQMLFHFNQPRSFETGAQIAWYEAIAL